MPARTELSLPKSCEKCGGLYPRPACYSNRQWDSRRYCSTSCAQATFSSVRRRQWSDPVYKQHMREVHRGKPSPNKGKRRPNMCGPLNHKWKGDAANYYALHSWLRREYGPPLSCEFCDATRNERRLEWANKSGQYHRYRSDWMALCPSCHRRYDHAKRHQDR